MLWCANLTTTTCCRSAVVCVCVCASEVKHSGAFFPRAQGVGQRETVHVSPAWPCRCGGAATGHLCAGSIRSRVAGQLHP